MTQKFMIQLKSQGRTVIPSYVRIAEKLQPGDWMELVVRKIEKP